MKDLTHPLKQRGDKFGKWKFLPWPLDSCAEMGLPATLGSIPGAAACGTEWQQISFPAKTGNLDKLKFATILRELFQYLNFDVGVHCS